MQAAFALLPLLLCAVVAQRTQKETSKLVGDRTEDRLDAFLMVPQLINLDFDKFRKMGGE